jgi:hypothetical protein
MDCRSWTRPQHWLADATGSLTPSKPGTIRDTVPLLALWPTLGVWRAGTRPPPICRGWAWCWRWDFGFTDRRELVGRGAADRTDFLPGCCCRCRYWIPTCRPGGLCRSVDGDGVQSGGDRLLPVGAGVATVGKAWLALLLALACPLIKVGRNAVWLLLFAPMLLAARLRGRHCGLLRDWWQRCWLRRSVWWLTRRNRVQHSGTGRISADAAPLIQVPYIGQFTSRLSRQLEPVVMNFSGVG